MPRFTTSGSTYGAFYARPQAPSVGVKKPTASIDNPYANSLIGINAAACYERYGYTVVRVPPLPPASRLAFVLQGAGVFPKFVQ